MWNKLSDLTSKLIILFHKCYNYYKSVVFIEGVELKQWKIYKLFTLLAWIFHVIWFQKAQTFYALMESESNESLTIIAALEVEAVWKVIFALLIAFSNLSSFCLELALIKAIDRYDFQ